MTPVPPNSANRTDLGTLVALGEPRPQKSRRLFDRGFLAFCLFVTTIAVMALVVLLTSVMIEGIPMLSWDFLENYTSRNPEEAGIKAPLWGSIWSARRRALLSRQSHMGSENPPTWPEAVRTAW